MTPAEILHSHIGDTGVKFGGVMVRHEPTMHNTLPGHGCIRFYFDDPNENSRSILLKWDNRLVLEILTQIVRIWEVNGAINSQRHNSQISKFWNFWTDTIPLGFCKIEWTTEDIPTEAHALADCIGWLMVAHGEVVS
jgi:hypothetical protein